MRIAELKAIYSGNPIQISKRKVFLDIIYEMEVEPSVMTPISRQGQLTLKYIRHVLQIWISSWSICHQKYEIWMRDL